MLNKLVSRRDHVSFLELWKDYCSVIVSIEIKSLYNYLEVKKIQDLCHDPARTVARHLTQKIAKSGGFEPHCVLGSFRKFNLV